MAGIKEVGEKLASEYNLTQASAKATVVTVLDIIAEMAMTEKVRIGRHSFKPTIRQARQGVNPKTLAKIQIPEKHGIKYKFNDKTATAPEPAPVAKKARGKK